MLTNLARKVVHVATGNRVMYERELAKVAATMPRATVLEVGSGKRVGDGYPYSAVHLFGGAAEFVMTDLNGAFGHRVLDVTELDEVAAYDLVLCLNVLEHVYDFQRAVDNLHTAVKDGGTLVVAVPFTFPLHDEPADFWRFTEHALRRMLADFSRVEIKHQRGRRWPTGYLAVATK